MNICAHLKIVKLIINEQQLKEVVIYHNQVLDLINKFNKIFNQIIFGEYTVKSVPLCVVGYLIVMSDDIFIITVCIVHGMAGIIELLIFSYGGQKIMDYGEEICDECYEIDKNYLIIMMMTKYKLRMYSLIHDACLSTVTLILNRAMALITLLKSFT
jgi:hypothetical protein